MKLDWTTGDYADGPELARWVTEHEIGVGYDHPHYDDWVHVVSCWRKGRKVSVATLDFHLTRIGCHLSQVPDRCWRQGEIQPGRMGPGALSLAGEPALAAAATAPEAV